MLLLFALVEKSMGKWTFQGLKSRSGPAALRSSAALLLLAEVSAPRVELIMRRAENDAQAERYRLILLRLGLRVRGGHYAPWRPICMGILASILHRFALRESLWAANIV
jgi:hypothetical protein